MKILNKYTYLLVGILGLISIVLLAVMPRFETQEFDPDRIEEYLKESPLLHKVQKIIVKQIIHHQLLMKFQKLKRLKLKSFL